MITIDRDRTILMSNTPPDDSERTVLRPMPGGRGTGRARTPMNGLALASGPTPRVSERPVPIAGSGLNPLVDAATALLALMTQLRNTATHADVASLRSHVEQEMKNFDSAARARGTRSELVVAARYALCTLLDETVLSTPWGNKSLWARRTLLSTFHQETWGGDKFFTILARMLQEPARNLELLELIYICLSLGFEGKYQVLEGGRRRLEEIKDNLFRTIRMQRGDFERELSPHWRGIQDRRNALVRYVPWWVVAASAGALLLAIYIGFSFSVNSASDPVYANLQDIAREPPSLPSAPRPSQLDDLRRVLAAESHEGRVELKQTVNGTTVVLGGEGLFASGRADVKREQRELLARIANALNRIAGTILVTGHTDRDPIRTPRFPSNWHLSQARADAVVQILAETIDPSRLVAEGRADSEPMARYDTPANDTPANKARNRRVEITLTRLDHEDGPLDGRGLHAGVP